MPYSWEMTWSQQGRRRVLMEAPGYRSRSVLRGAKSDNAYQHLCTQVLSIQALQLGFQNLSCFGGI